MLHSVVAITTSFPMHHRTHLGLLYRHRTLLYKKMLHVLIIAITFSVTYLSNKCMEFRNRWPPYHRLLIPVTIMYCFRLFIQKWPKAWIIFCGGVYLSQVAYVQEIAFSLVARRTHCNGANMPQNTLEKALKTLHLISTKVIALFQHLHALTTMIYNT